MSIFGIGATFVGLSALFGYINHRFFRLPHMIVLVVIARAASLPIIGFDLVEPSVHIGERVAGAASAGGFPVSPPGLAGH